MGFILKIAAKLGVSRQRGEFELLESESGAPGFFGGWREKNAKQARDGRRIPNSLNGCIALVREGFRADINPDVIIRRFKIGETIPAAAVFMNGMADGDMINDYVIREGMRKNVPAEASSKLDYIIENVFSACDVGVDDMWAGVKRAVTDGKTVVFIEGEARAAVIDTRGYEHRSVGMAQNEKVVRGPQEGFNENLRTNVTLLRRVIRRADLVCEFRDAGGDSNVKAGIVYLEGSANITLIEEVKRRLGQVDTRTVMNAGIMEQLTETSRLSPFPQLLSTERPDRAASYIMQGYVVLLLEGSPFANVMPTTFFALMASSEDTYLREPQGSAVRFVRYLGAALSVLLPAYFLSLSMYHQGMLSSEVLSTIVASRKMVFAPIGLELIFLLAVFQLIREAGLRVPGSIGQAIGIIGGLILGQAAVSANLASSVILIVVALAGLGNFCIPDYSTQIAASYIRVAFVIAAWMGGFLGMSCMAVILVGWTARLKSYGVPFLAPAAPKTYSKRPFVLRGPITMHKKADDYMNTKEDE